jgi:ubiquitin C-terminal hydrolase
VVVPLRVQGKNDISAALADFCTTELLEQDNQYYCDHCNKKQDALKGIAISEPLPNNLIFGLKRFSFDFNMMTRIKVNDKMEFPMKIDMSKYVGLAEENESERLLEYELVASINHIGTADAGHYFAYIKDTNSGHWYSFNDTLYVTSFC